MTSFKPRPVPAIEYARNVGAAYPKHGRNIAVPHRASHTSDLTHVIFSQNGTSCRRATKASAVDHHIGLVLFDSFPFHVEWVYATLMTLAAIMRGLMLRRRRFTMNRAADQIGHILRFAVDVYAPVSLAVPMVWPSQTIVSFVRNGDGFNKFRQFAIKGPASKRIAMAYPPTVVGRTVSLGANALATTVNAAYSWGSHFAVISCGSVRARLRALQLLGGLVFYRLPHLTLQGRG